MDVSIPGLDAAGPFWSAAIPISRWLLLAAIMIVSLAMCYRIGPCRAAPKWRWVVWGAAAGAALWILASLGFSLYVRHVANYETAYGVAGSVLTVMIWLYLVAYAVLLGAALNAEMERQTSLDTTIGADRPVGARGAKAADHKPE
jgi:membrane protein